MSTKLCLFCSHCERIVNEGYGGDGDCSGFHCHKAHFSMYGKGDDKSLRSNTDVRELFKRAHTCSDYERVAA